MRDRLVTSAFVLAFAAHFFAGLVAHSFLHLPAFLAERGANEITIGLVMGSLGAAAVAVRPLLGWVMDTRGRRVVAIGASALHVVACLLYLGVERIGPYVFFVRLVHGVAQAGLFSVFFTIAADIVPASRRTQGIALFGISGMLPMSIGGLLGDFVLARGSWELFFLVDAAIAVVALVATFFVRESRAPRATSDAPSRAFWASAVQADLMPLWLVGFSFAAALAGVFTFLKTFVLEIGVGTIGTFFTGYTLAALALRVFFSWIPDRIGPKRTLYPALASTVIGLVVLSQTSSLGGLIAAAVLCGMGHGYAFPIVSALVVERARASERGAAVSLFTALFDLGMLIGAPTMGAIAAATDLSTMFATGAALIALGGTTFLLWDRPR